MNHLPFRVAHHWITRLTQLPHPIMINHIPPLAQELGWEDTQEIEEHLYHYRSTPILIRTLFDKQDNQIYSASFSVARDPAKTLQGGISIADLYCKYLEACTKHWGQPCDFTTSTTGAIWKFNSHAYLKVTGRPASVIFSFETIDPNGLW